jgi:hypothetical protein
VGTVSEPEQAKVRERYRHWQLALEGTAAHAVDRTLAQLGVQFAEGTVDLAKLGKLMAYRADDLQKVLDYGAGRTTATERGTAPTAPPIQDTTPNVGANIPAPAAVVEEARVAPPLSTAADRRRAVDEFLAKANMGWTGNDTLKRTHFWKAMGYKDATQFQAWQAVKPTAASECDQNCRRMLARSTEEFIALVIRRQGGG